MDTVLAFKDTPSRAHLQQVKAEEAAWEAAKAEGLDLVRPLNRGTTRVARVRFCRWHWRYRSFRQVAIVIFLAQVTILPNFVLGPVTSVRTDGTSIGHMKVISLVCVVG